MTDLGAKLDQTYIINISPKTREMRQLWHFFEDNFMNAEYSIRCARISLLPTIFFLQGLSTLGLLKKT